MLEPVQKELTAVLDRKQAVLQELFRLEGEERALWRVLEVLTPPPDQEDAPSDETEAGA